MGHRWVIAALLIVTASCGGDALPPHTLASSTPLRAGSQRLEIHVTTGEFSKPQCEALIAHYRAQAGPAGQVSVRKPSAALGGQLTPWCIDNLDGAGVRFNDALF